MSASRLHPLRRRVGRKILAVDENAIRGEGTREGNDVIRRAMKGADRKR